MHLLLVPRLQQHCYGKSSLFICHGQRHSISERNNRSSLTLQTYVVPYNKFAGFIGSVRDFLLQLVGHIRGPYLVKFFIYIVTLVSTLFSTCWTIYDGEGGSFTIPWQALGRQSRQHRRRKGQSRLPRHERKPFGHPPKATSFLREGGGGQLVQ